MKFVAVDTETHLISPGRPAPKLVCVSIAKNEGKPEVLSRSAGLGLLRWFLEDENTTIIGYNIAFDLGVACAEDPATFVPLAFRAFEQFRVRDAIVRQQLIDIASGTLKFRWDEQAGEYIKSGYALEQLAWLHLGRKLAKGENTWRLRYAELDGVRVEDWPVDAREYAATDAQTTLDVFWKQAAAAAEDGKIPCEERATREAWALWLMSAWGVRTDGARVMALRAELEKEQAAAMGALRPSGIFRADGTRDMSKIGARVEAAYAERGVPRTPTGRISTEFEVLANSGDPELEKLAAVGKGAKILSTYIPVLETGAAVPINARFNSLVESGRTSCAKPNLQNPPRKGGVRECFVPRPGHFYCSVDYDTLELRALAQACLDLFGRSDMAAALRAGEDLHLRLAADLLEIAPTTAAARSAAGDAEVAEWRQLAKVANFGFPGGLSAKTFVSYAAGYGMKVAPELAERLRTQWLRSWPEMLEYFEYVKAEVGGGGDGTITIERTGFVRGGLRFTQGANHHFQSLAATGAKDALWRVSKECYCDRDSPLWGTRPVIFMHDEILAEVPEDRAAAAAAQLAATMIETMQRWLPDVPVLASPILMRRWYKGAKPVRGTDGVLVPSRPQVQGNKMLWIEDSAASEMVQAQSDRIPDVVASGAANAL